MISPTILSAKPVNEEYIVLLFMPQTTVMVHFLLYWASWFPCTFLLTLEESVPDTVWKN
ncbi:hypothetical protein [Coleofasciculus sp.]|uniref:hypothetical protein n=1 Tax=Coleofasciculus sp. TaxID=3100458 RepID=UPI0039FA6B01